MALTVTWTRAAHKEMQHLDRSVARRVLDAVERFAASGEGNVIQLQGVTPVTFRLRVGDWRVQFERAGESAIEVVAVAHRREAYR